MQLSDRSFDLSAQRDLSVVDDANLRKDLFSTSKNLLKKIQRLEKDYAEFISCDQVMYHDWYKVTFKVELQNLERMEKRQRNLANFHVHLQYVSQKSDVSLSESYQLLKNEEEQYQSGDESWRFVIDKLRSERFSNATKKTTPPLAPASPSRDQYVEELILNLGDVLRGDDSALSGLRRYPRSVYHYLNEVDDAMMARHLSDLAAGYQLFKESFQIAMKCGDWKLLSRIWRVGGVGYQQKLLKPMPAHLKEFLKKTFAEQAADELQKDTDAEAPLVLRSSYRKLARLLHPDTQGPATSAEHQEWAAKRWEKAQAVYAASDAAALKRLEIICLAELGELSSMTLEEIYESSLALNDEYEALKKSLRMYRRHPAWKFSTRRKYEILKKRIRNEFVGRMAPLQAQILSYEKLITEAAGKRPQPNSI